MIQIYDYYTGDEIPYTKFRFPGGELQVKIDPDFVADDALVIQWLYQSDVELMEVALLKDAFSNLGQKVVFLDIPYLPYARQDRVCSPGEAFALKVFADMVNTLDFKGVICSDPHNEDMFHRLFDSAVVEEQSTSCVHKLFASFERNQYDYILFPDAGALKKREQYQARIEDYDLLVAIGSKVRDPATGALTGFDVDVQDFKGGNVLVVDDICDGGGTFLGLGAVIKQRNCGTLSLFTTHGIYSKGMEALEEMFDGGVYCAYRKLPSI